jgi:predicted cytidylate kinase
VIITISGRPGSGKSVVASKVADVLGVRHVSAGDFMREMAAEREISILELSRLAELDDSIDGEIDGRTRDLADSGEDFVIDARLGWRFVPESYKVFLDVRPEVAARRIYGAKRGTERENIDLETTYAAIELRTRSETSRYQDYYGLDYTDPAHYDLVVDTSELTVDQVVHQILSRSQSDGLDHDRQ